MGMKETAVLNWKTAEMPSIKPQTFSKIRLQRHQSHNKEDIMTAHELLSMLADNHGPLVAEDVASMWGIQPTRRLLQ